MRALRFSVLVLGSIVVLSGCTFSDVVDYFSDTEDDTTYTTTDTSTTDSSTTATSIFASDFTDVCNGVPQAKAAAYTETVGIHPTLLFDRESTTASYYQKSFTLPEAWEKPWEEVAQTELVVCVTTLPKDMVESCPFDGETSGSSYTLNNYAADYDVALYSAQDGKQLATTTLSLPAEECPSFYYFTNSVENNYPDYKQSLVDFLKPYVQK